MFHPINRIECPGLDKLNEIAFHTAEFALTWQFVLTSQDDGDKLDEIKAHFITHLKAKGYPEAGAWLWRKRKAIREPLLTLLDLSPEEKRAILDAFTADRDIERCFEQGAFCQSSIPPSCQTSFKNLQTLLENFYTKILADKGVPSKVIGQADSLTRQTVLRAYLNAQNIHVCPGCDGPPPSIDAVNQAIHDDLDHFFAKSLYPFLTLHPLNLTPFCKHCNQTYKKDRDAILDDDDEVADVRDMHHIYHPYLRPARDRVNISVYKESNTSPPQIKISPKENNQTERARVNSLNYILRLDSRWSGDLQAQRLEQPIKSYFIYSTNNARDQGIDCDEEYLLQRLPTIVETVRSEVGGTSGRVPALGFSEWLVNSQDAQAELLRIASIALSRPAVR